MYVLVNAAGVTLEEPEDLQRFHVAVHGPSRAALESSGFGTLAPDGDHAVISVAAVRAAAAGRVGPEWEAGFEKMLAYARSKGWLDEAGTGITAHIEQN